MNRINRGDPFPAAPCRLVGALLILIAAAWAGCAGLRPEMMSNDPATFISVDTVQTAGPVVVPVYREQYYANFDIPQHQLPLEAPQDGERSVRTVRTIQLVWPAKNYLYAFTVCDVSKGATCQPQSVTLFFSLGCRSGSSRINCRRLRFDRPSLRSFRLVADGTALDVPSLRYERHGAGPYLEELWVTIPYATFQQAVQADAVRFEIGRENRSLRGGEVKPLRAISAAVAGRATLARSPDID